MTDSQSLNLVTDRFEVLLTDARKNLVTQKGYLAQREKDLAKAKYSLAVAVANVEQLDRAMDALQDDGTRLPTAFHQLEEDLSSWVDSMDTRQREVAECEKHVTVWAERVELHTAEVMEFDALLSILADTKNPTGSELSESETNTDRSTT